MKMLEFIWKQKKGPFRRNKIMPINIYKGDYMNSEKNWPRVYLDQNPDYGKISYFNMVDKDDRNDLHLILKI